MSEKLHMNPHPVTEGLTPACTPKFRDAIRAAGLNPLDEGTYFELRKIALEQRRSFAKLGRDVFEEFLANKKRFTAKALREITEGAK